MSASSSDGAVPQDLVAIFHASFHPTQGNVLDWHMKTGDDVDLGNVEFNCLPSGLHLVEEDVVYFSSPSHQGVCIFRRRSTTEEGHRGFRLSSLGVLLARSDRPRPWYHVPALKDLVHDIYGRLEATGVLEPTDRDWEPAREFFARRRVKSADLGGAGEWRGWTEELDGTETNPSQTPPTIHLTHMLRILGPSIFTLYKHVLGRRRILLFTLPPVEAACTLCQVAADLCLDDQLARVASREGTLIDDFDDLEGGSSAYEEPSGRKLKGRCKSGIKVLGMVTLNDLDKMEREGKSGTGWIACTTDAIFLERPAHYDLLIDMTTSTPAKVSRPMMHLSYPIQRKPGARGPTHGLSTIHSTWSDVKLWTELDRILKLDSDTHHTHTHGPFCSDPSSPRRGAAAAGAWTPDVWRIYEDVCVLCAGLWLGPWRKNSVLSYSTLGGRAWGAPRADGDDDLSLDGTRVRVRGRGIEGRPEGSGSLGGKGKWGIKNRQPSGVSTLVAPVASTSTDLVDGSTDDDRPAPPTKLAVQEAARARREQQARTAHALVQTFGAHTRATLSTLADLLPPAGGAQVQQLVLTPRDILAFELGPMSALDAKFVEWLVEEYGGGVECVVRRGWRDLFGLLLGLG